MMLFVMLKDREVATLQVGIQMDQNTSELFSLMYCWIGYVFI